MNDRHVESLRYKLEADPGLVFSDPHPLEGETDKAHWRLENGILTVEIKDHFADVESAKRAVYPFLRSWELGEALSAGQRIAFAYQDAKVIDRDPPPPPPPGVHILKVEDVICSTSISSPTLRLVMREYPASSEHFHVNPDVETLSNRFEGYEQGREPLLGMGYFCLTVLEAQAGNRKRAAEVYRVSKDVLRKLGELTAENRGDEKTARKLKASKTGGSAALVPISPMETHWIEATIKAIIRRVGEIDGNPSPPVLTLSDLPSLQTQGV